MTGLFPSHDHFPGCEGLEQAEDQGFCAAAKMKVGPVSARFKGRDTPSDLDPPNGYRISEEGEAASRAFAEALISPSGAQ
jgi:uncharacterized protein